MRFVIPREDGNEVAYCTSEDTLGWRKLGSWVRCIAMLEHSSLESIYIEFPVRASVGGNHAFRRFDTDFSSAVRVGECYGQEPVVNSPYIEKVLSCM